MDIDSADTRRIIGPLAEWSDLDHSMIEQNSAEAPVGELPSLTSAPNTESQKSIMPGSLVQVDSKSTVATYLDLSDRNSFALIRRPVTAASHSELDSDYDFCSTVDRPSPERVLEDTGRALTIVNPSAVHIYQMNSACANCATAKSVAEQQSLKQNFLGVARGLVWHIIVTVFNGVLESWATKYFG